MLMKTEILLPYTGGQVNVAGEPVKAIGWYSNQTASNLSSIWLYTTNLVGRVHLYGSLSLEPQEKDWVELKISEEARKEPYLEFDNRYINKKITDNRCINIEGAFTFLKLTVDRSYLDWIKYNLIAERKSGSIMDRQDGTAHFIHNGGYVDIQAYKNDVYEKIGVVNKAVLTF